MAERQVKSFVSLAKKALLLPLLLLILSGLLPQQVAASQPATDTSEEAPIQLATSADLTVDTRLAPVGADTVGSDSVVLGYDIFCQMVLDNETGEVTEVCPPGAFTEAQKDEVDRCLLLNYEERRNDAGCSRPEIDAEVREHDNGSWLCDITEQCDPSLDASCWDTDLLSSAGVDCVGGVVQRGGDIANETFTCDKFGVFGEAGTQSIDPVEQERCRLLRESNDQALADAAEQLNPLNWIVDGIQKSIGQMVVDGFKWGMQWLGTYAFSNDADLFNPVVDCEARADKSAACDPWFVQQLSLMGQVGLWLVIPLMGLVVIQSVIRGSMFLLTRAFFIMLPVAVVGAVVISTMAQILLNISDDFSAAILAIAFSDQQLENIVNSLSGLVLDGDEDGWLFTILFLVAIVLGIIVIFLELLLREVGVYLSTLFLPLAFAGLVWPASVKWARRLVEVLIGLIFSKVFIVAGLSLGFSMVGALNEGGAIEPNLVNLGMLLAVIGATALAPTKMLAFVPGGSDATEGRLGNPSNITAKGEALGVLAGRRANYHQGRLNSVTPDPRAPFRNS